MMNELQQCARAWDEFIAYIMRPTDAESLATHLADGLYASPLSRDEMLATVIDDDRWIRYRKSLEREMPDLARDCEYAGWHVVRVALRNVLEDRSLDVEWAWRRTI